MHGPTCIFWANLTTFSPAPQALLAAGRADAVHRGARGFYAVGPGLGRIVAPENNRGAESLHKSAMERVDGGTTTRPNPSRWTTPPWTWRSRGCGEFLSIGIGGFKLDQNDGDHVVGSYKRL
jgi:hypothetical protein